MIETQKSVSQWSRETFGECKSVDIMYERLYNEFEELEATVQRGKYQNIPNELADCLIVMYSLASILKIDLMHEVDKKMNINRRRKWKLHGDGTGQHID